MLLAKKRVERNQQNQNKGKAHVPPGLIERVEIVAIECMAQPEKVDDPVQQSLRHGAIIVAEQCKIRDTDDIIQQL